MSKTEDTPLMRQWREAKSRHRDALIFFRVGDFYEMFNEDAVEGAELLGLTLTTRNNGAAADVPMAGVPARARDEYIQRLIRMGRRVAICEQVEDPAEAKGLVRREVVETVTPGAVLSDSLLAERRNNFLVSLTDYQGSGTKLWALAAADLSTGEVLSTSVDSDSLLSELARLEPAELLLPESREGIEWLDEVGASLTYRPDWLFDPSLGEDELRRHYRVQNLDGFGFQGEDEGLIAALGALVTYLLEVQPTAATQLSPPRIERSGEAMILDEMTRRNLELVEPLRTDSGGLPSGRSGTLIEVIDETLTPMGARLLRRWLLRPLVVVEEIWRRQEGVAELVEDTQTRRALREELRSIRDLERLAGKAGASRITPRELGTLGDSLGRLPSLLAALGSPTSPILAELAASFDTLTDIQSRIAETLADELPATLGDGGVIREGHDPELDELRQIRDGGQETIAALQARERERTGIPSLKVGYNRVFGYYIEVTRTHLERVPPEYERRQTLTGSERYVTPELKEWEAKIFGAEERIAALEARLFGELRAAVAAEIERLRATAEDVATLDALAGLAELAERRDYIRPEVHTGYELEIRGGRHPVVETMMPREEFIPNDLDLDDEARIMILTGPNMAGKSTFLRQVGLIQLLAQVGSFVPADAARLPVADRIFTRVGASDNLVRGQSTFMVEMQETAAILHGATERSIVLLDEIGRGTATYDGVSIAWAVTEHLHEVTGAKTIFATHYHELTQLADQLAALVNYNVSVREVDDDIIFLRRLEPGGADRSYGIQVGRLAGLPVPVVERAREILLELEGAHTAEGVGLGRRGAHRPGGGTEPLQFSLFQGPEPPVLEKLRKVQIDELTPLEALNLLAELSAEARGRDQG